MIKYYFLAALFFIAIPVFWMLRNLDEETTIPEVYYEWKHHMTCKMPWSEFDVY